jgi:hypothetical protein
MPLQDRVFARARRDYGVIRAAVGTDIPQDITPSRNDVLAEIATHTWVQAFVDGSWIDLDSAFPDSEPGRSFCAAERTLDTLPLASYQQVTIRVIAEYARGSALTRETALEVRTRAERVLDREIFLLHVRKAGLGSSLTRAMSGASDDNWSPVLWVEGETRSGKPILFADGSVPASRPAEEAQTGGALSRGLGELFGEAPAARAARIFVAERLEFEIVFPGGRREVTTRTLVDRAKLTWRKDANRDPRALHALARNNEGAALRDARAGWWELSTGYGDVRAVLENLNASYKKYPTFFENPRPGEWSPPRSLKGYRGNPSPGKTYHIPNPEDYGDSASELQKYKDSEALKKAPRKPKGREVGSEVGEYIATGEPADHRFKRVNFRI